MPEVPPVSSAPPPSARVSIDGRRPQAGRAPVLYGLDIETDTSIDGLDPAVSRIVAVGVAGPDGVRVFDDSDEALLLDRLDWHLAALEPGVITTWNGAAFDLPFLADRARRHDLRLGLRLALDPELRLRHGAMPGHLGAYRASWHGHSHLDAYRVFRADVVPALGVSGGLKAIARVCGLRPVEVDVARLHQLTRDDIHAYVASDASCTRQLIERRWPTARTAVDHLPPSLPAHVPPAIAPSTSPQVPLPRHPQAHLAGRIDAPAGGRVGGRVGGRAGGVVGGPWPEAGAGAPWPAAPRSRAAAVETVG